MEDPISVYTAARNYIRDGEEAGWLEFVYQYANGRNSVALVDLPTIEEAYNYLVDYPLYNWQEYEIHPLVDVEFSFEKGLKQMAAMAMN